jgi:hypothetical protein
MSRPIESRSVMKLSDGSPTKATAASSGASASNHGTPMTLQPSAERSKS